jgi:hypothetical protein
MLTAAAPARVTLRPGGLAYFGINKNSCVSRATGTAASLESDPPGGSFALHTNLPRYPVIGYCGGNDPGAIIGISPVESTERAVLASR